MADTVLNYADFHLPSKILFSIPTQNTEISFMILHPDIEGLPLDSSIPDFAQRLREYSVVPYLLNCAPEPDKIEAFPLYKGASSVVAFSRPVRFHTVRFGRVDDKVLPLVQEFERGGYRVADFSALHYPDGFDPLARNPYARMYVRRNGEIEISGGAKQIFVDLVERLL